MLWRDGPIPYNRTKAAVSSALDKKIWKPLEYGVISGTIMEIVEMLGWMKMDTGNSISREGPCRKFPSNRMVISLLNQIASSRASLTITAIARKEQTISKSSLESSACD